MTLAEYLASEQARDRLKTADVLTMPSASEWHGHGQKVVIEQYEAWWRVSVAVADETTVAYYRPDGDRYVVTDLGEGVRALRLRGASIQRLGDAISEVLGAMWVANQLPPSYGITGMVNGEIAPMSFIDAADLPDAICRVMLASLRVAGAGR